MKKGAQNPSVLTVKELQASLNYKEKAKSVVLKRRCIRATHRASISLKAGKCFKKQSTTQPHQIHGPHFFPIPLWDLKI
jgi:hypothetical protein